MSLRNALYVGVLAAVVIGLFLVRLWQPEEQVRKHSAHLLDAIAQKNWAKFSTFIAANYHDEWGNNRAVVIERTRELFRRIPGIRLNAIGPTVRLQDGSGFWRANITVDGPDNSELVAELKTRLNSIQTPFELEWHRESAKPWDWKLVIVRNPDLVVPSEY